MLLKDWQDLKREALWVKEGCLKKEVCVCVCVWGGGGGCGGGAVNPLQTMVIVYVYESVFLVVAYRELRDLLKL